MRNYIENKTHRNYFHSESTTINIGGPKKNGWEWFLAIVGFIGAIASIIGAL